MCLFHAGAVDEKGKMPFYAEECASMLAVTFSSGRGSLRSIVSLIKQISKFSSGGQRKQELNDGLHSTVNGGLTLDLFG